MQKLEDWCNGEHSLGKFASEAIARARAGVPTDLCAEGGSDSFMTAIREIRERFCGNESFPLEACTGCKALEFLRAGLSRETGCFDAEVSRMAQEEFEAAVAEGAKLVVAGHVTFPWKALFIPLEQADRMMERLACYAPKVEESSKRPSGVRLMAQKGNGAPLLRLGYKGKGRVFVHDERDYDAMDVLVDLFQERARLSAKRIDSHQSPLRGWKEDEPFVRDVLRKAGRDYGKWNAKCLRESIYALAKEATQFKPSMAVAVMKELGAKRVLDFSAGWGDRMVGAIASGVQEYLGFDPNEELKAGHEALRSRYASPSQDVRIIYEPFERAASDHAPAERYDLCFTSPPYFDFEKYSDGPGQSVSAYPDFDVWMANFLFVSCDKAWRALCPGGRLALHLADAGRRPMCEPVLLFALAFFRRCKYEGVLLSRGGAGKMRPIWILLKSEQPVSERFANRAADELKRLYPGIWRLARSHVDKARTKRKVEGDAAQSDERARKKFRKEGGLNEEIDAYVSTKYAWDRLVRHVIERKGKNVRFLEKWDHANFVWKSALRSFDQFDRLEWVGGLVNHLCRNDRVTTKKGLDATLRKHGVMGVCPPTWVYKGHGNPKEFAEKLPKWQHYILKPAAGYEGRGIKLAHSAEQVGDWLGTKEMVVQKLVDPQLSSEGKKFDIRAFVAVAQDRSVYMSEFVYARVNAHPYDPLDTRTAITNVTAGAKPDFLERMVEDASGVVTLVREALKKLFTHPVVEELAGGYRCAAELFGADLMLDKGGRVYLLEVNENPTLCHGEERIDAMLEGVVKQFLFSVMGLPRRSSCVGDDGLQSCGFRPLGANMGVA